MFRLVVLFVRGCCLGGVVWGVLFGVGWSVLRWWFGACASFVRRSLHTTAQSQAVAHTTHYHTTAPLSHHQPLSHQQPLSHHHPLRSTNQTTHHTHHYHTTTTPPAITPPRPLSNHPPPSHPPSPITHPSHTLYLVMSVWNSQRPEASHAMQSSGWLARISASSPRTYART